MRSEGASIHMREDKSTWSNGEQTWGGGGGFYMVQMVTNLHEANKGLLHIVSNWVLMFSQSHRVTSEQIKSTRRKEGANLRRNKKSTWNGDKSTTAKGRNQQEEGTTKHGAKGHKFTTDSHRPWSLPVCTFVQWQTQGFMTGSHRHSSLL